MAGSTNPRLGTARVWTAIARTVSRLRSGLPWFDIHLPGIPVPVGSDRVSIPGQRAIVDVHRAGATR